MNKKVDFLNNLRRKLYSKGEDKVESEKGKIYSDLDYDVRGDWSQDFEEGSKEEQKEDNYFKFVNKKKTKKKRKSKLGYFLLGSFLFFLFSFVVGFLFLTSEPNVVSSKNVKIEIFGPPEVKGGEKTALDVSVTNNNNSNLEVVDMIVYYPDGTLSSNTKKEKPAKERISLGEMSPGETVLQKIEGIFFGEQNEEMEVRIEAEYRVEGSNAIFSSENSFPLVIGSSPLLIIVDAPDQVVSGKEISISVLVSSNSEELISKSFLSADYPFGFSFDSASTDPDSGGNIWELGDIPPAGEKEITITGVLKGQSAEERVFKFKTGIIDEEEEKITIAKKDHLLSIKKSFLGTSLAFNGSTLSPYKAVSGQKIRADLSYENNTTSKIYDAEIELSIEGYPFDERSISVTGGFYNSLENKIIWNKGTESSLSEILPGGSGRLKFSFDLKELSSFFGTTDPKVDINVNVKGKRVTDEGRVPENVESSSVSEILVTSLLRLAPRALYYSGPFENSGPIPPEAEDEITYTIVWVITNSSNELKDAKVSASLPSYVDWTGETKVDVGNLDYNSVGGVIEWNIGEVAPGDKKEVAFKIKFKPSLSQVGTEPVIIRNQMLTAFDKFSKDSIEKSYGSLTTDLTTEPNFGLKDGVVTD